MNERTGGSADFYCDGTAGVRRGGIEECKDKAGHRSIWAGSRPYLVRLRLDGQPLAARGAVVQSDPFFGARPCVVSIGFPRSRERGGHASGEGRRCPRA